MLNVSISFPAFEAPEYNTSVDLKAFSALCKLDYMHIFFPINVETLPVADCIETNYTIAKVMDSYTDNNGHKLVYHLYNHFEDLPVAEITLDGYGNRFELMGSATLSNDYFHYVDVWNHLRLKRRYSKMNLMQF